MADDDQKPPVDNADKGEDQKPPAGGDAGSGNDSDAHLQLPEKFRGKSPEEIAKAYVELETKLGEQSKDIEEARKTTDQVDTLLKAIWSDPDLYRQVEQGVAKYTSGGTLPEPDKTSNGTKSDEDAQKTEVKVDPAIKELKIVEENRVLGDFFKKYGYDQLSEAERKDKYAKLSLSMAELVDPGGSRPIREILDSIPTSKLGRYLENAHFIANKDMVIDQAKNSALLTSRENESATMGSFSTNGRSGEESVTLSKAERDIANKMGISEEQYAKRKLQIKKEEKRFG